jgi:hypothetical protein
MNSPQIRDELAARLGLDLIGPGPGHAFSHELLPEPPNQWYLCGFLLPADATGDEREDPTSSDEVDGAEPDDGRSGDDAGARDAAAARKSFFPSSIGLSVLIPAGTELLEAEVTWGDYLNEAPEVAEPENAAGKNEPAVSERSDGTTVIEPKKAISSRPRGYRREPRAERVRLVLPPADRRAEPVLVPNSGGLELQVTLRNVAPVPDRIAPGTRAVSVFLVNNRPTRAQQRYRSWIFQAMLRLDSAAGFVPRPDPRGTDRGTLADEWDERLNDLHYRDAYEWAVGHGCGACPVVVADDKCTAVETTWLPRAGVPRVAPAPLAGVMLEMSALAALPDGAAARAALTPLAAGYRAWIERQRALWPTLTLRRREVAETLLGEASTAAARIEAGIELLASEPQILTAFRLANRAMERAARQREAQKQGVKPSAVRSPAWYPFQLAFVLLNLRGLAYPEHDDRATVDLLFFPTGGGKTEAYLGLAAFTMVLRRLRHPGLTGAGVTVLMRYTLRLLTLDQLARGAGLICALELERLERREQGDVSLGDWPFEIGLWVGSAATPNRMGEEGDKSPDYEKTAYTRTNRFNRDGKRYPQPLPLEECPWCGTRFEGGGKSFRLVGADGKSNAKKPVHLEVRCVSPTCDFSSDRPLPIVTVDEPIYRRLPAFVIATVDKFAGLPWMGRTGTLFGKVERFQPGLGFFGPCDAGGSPLPGPLPPPELIIQDELHLISGPLGTIAGVYETALEALASRREGEQTVRPKIVASTATVRRARTQIRALFGRGSTAVFPPPGVDRRDSFFAETLAENVSPPRLYLGVAAQGRSLKVVLLRVALALLAAAQRFDDEEGGAKNPARPADPYLTLLGYFNSLRELGGSRRIVEDEVYSRIQQYDQRRRLEPDDQLFAARRIQREPVELTSRKSTGEVAEGKQRLAQPFGMDGAVDVALATNMISVGLDISRLGLMVVLGQPKACAEYIQATSRVGRDQHRPGLVVTLLNVHKPRDRSHYERFGMFHETFYRAVEATSVTPFSPRALDRALAAALVAAVRQGRADFTPGDGASRILAVRSELEEFALLFANRAADHRPMSAEESRRFRDRVLQRSRKLLDDWLLLARARQAQGVGLVYQPKEPPGGARLLREMLDPDLAQLTVEERSFRANRSMRDVEPGVELKPRLLKENVVRT